MNTLFGKEKVEDVKEETNKEVTVWTHINGLQKGNYTFDENNVNSYSPWIVNKHLAQYIETLQIAIDMNTNYQITPKMHYDYVFNSMPSGKLPFKKWLKKDDKNKKEMKLIEDAANRFHVSFQKMKQYWSILSEADRKIIIEKYVYPDKNSKL